MLILFFINSKYFSGVSSSSKSLSIIPKSFSSFAFKTILTCKSLFPPVMINSEPFLVLFSSNSTGISRRGDKIFLSLLSLSTHSKKPIAKYKVLIPFSVKAVFVYLFIE